MPTPPLTPSPARMYDYMLGGNVNHQVDRDVADQLLAVAPELQDLARTNRRFLIRAVRHLATEAGIRQFLDIGSGLPTQENVHEAAQSSAPDARTVYVDNDASVLPQARQLIAGDGNTAYIQADARDPHHIRTHPDTVRLLDLTQPVAVLMVAVLHFIGDADDPYGIVRRIMDGLPSGSHLILAHVTQDGMEPKLAERMLPLAASLPVPLRFRDRAQITRFFDGLDLIDPPGVTDITQWGAAGERFPLRSYCGVARKA